MTYTAPQTQALYFATSTLLEGSVIPKQESNDETVKPEYAAGREYDVDFSMEDEEGWK